MKKLIIFLITILSINIIYIIKVDSFNTIITNNKKQIKKLKAPKKYSELPSNLLSIIIAIIGIIYVKKNVYS